MSENLTSFKSYLGKYYTELLYATSLEKYAGTCIDNIFEQRFIFQDNRVQMIVDPKIEGLSMSVTGNEIYISKELFDHPNTVIINSIEQQPTTNPKSLYNPEIFSTVAYLICQNHTTIQIVGEIDEPIYVTYRSEFETFYNSVVIFDIKDGIEVEIIEEVESQGVVNSVDNFILHPDSKLNLSTFYNNRKSAASYKYRNVIAQDRAQYSHTVYGRGSSNVVDETKIHAYEGSESTMYGIVNSNKQHFHSVACIEPVGTNYKIEIDYRDILSGKSNVTFYPVIVGKMPVGNTATINVSNIQLDEIPENQISTEIKNYIQDIYDVSTLTRIIGSSRFYNNKTRFLNFP